MTDLHHHDTRTIIEDRESPAAALVVLAVVVLLGVLIWLFAFSGVVFDRDAGTGGDVNIEQGPFDNGGTNTNDGTNDGTTTDPGGTEPQPAPS